MVGYHVSREHYEASSDVFLRPTMVSRLFLAHGELCASHPWEVIVATLTLTLCMLTVDRQAHANVASPTPTLHVQDHCNAYWRRSCPDGEEYNAIDVIVMTLIRCVAVLYSYYQFRNLKKLGSKYILGIAGLFTVFSSFVFSSSVINFMRSDISDFKDALFFFLLLIDLSKTSLLAQYALSSSTQEEVRHNIARGLAHLGPTITLDTIVETLVIGVGTLSGVHRLEVLCCFGCMSVIVNYIVFMTFYPACLSLILELSRSADVERPAWDMKGALSHEEDQKPNPVVQRVKVIMAAGLMMVHAHSRWTLSDAEVHPVDPLVPAERILNHNSTDDGALHNYIMKWLTVSADQIVVLILLLALAVKFVLFENREDQLEITSDKMASSADSQESKGGSNRGRVVWLGIRDDSEDNSTEDKEVQTEQEASVAPNIPVIVTPSKQLSARVPEEDNEEDKNPAEPAEPEAKPRSMEDCLEISKRGDASQLTDAEVTALVLANHIPSYLIEKEVDNPERGVGIRRLVLAKKANLDQALAPLPYRNYDYSYVMGACCENVIGYMPVPVGYAGPLNLDGERLFVPLATTEGCLVASTNRGCRALLNCGVKSKVVADGMTRGPVVRLPTMTRAYDVMQWIEDKDNFEIMRQKFDESSRFARLKTIKVRIIGRLLFLRFVASTGDAMGMNMLSKGTELALNAAKEVFPDMEILSLSGNYCTDKKPAAVNWIEGRGKSVVCEAIVPSKIVRDVLKTSVAALVDVNTNKNLIGSAIAGSIGGYNAHAANLVTAIYIATGQDPAQNIGSSNCMTLMEPYGEDGEDLYLSCTMPSIEVGTVGGGTVLPPQASCLEMLGVKGPNQNPGENARKLARIVCATVLAGELSLMSALTAGHLVKSHLRHNRSTTCSGPMQFSPLMPQFMTQSAPSTPAFKVRQCSGS